MNHNQATAGGTQKMKRLQWFRIGDAIPIDATLVRLETRETNEVVDEDPMGKTYGREEWALYEVPLII